MKRPTPDDDFPSRACLVLQFIIAIGLSIHLLYGVFEWAEVMKNPDPRNIGGWNDFVPVFLIAFAGLSMLSLIWLYKIIKKIS